MKKAKVLAVLCMLLFVAACGDNGAKDSTPSTTPKELPAQAVSGEDVSGEVSQDQADVVDGPNTKLRQAAFGNMYASWEPVLKMVKGEVDFDAALFKANVATFAAKSEEPFKHFQKNGEGLNGNAKSDIWSNADKFKNEEDKFKAAVAKLNETALIATDIAAVRADFGNVAISCGSCHKAFKKD